MFTATTAIGPARSPCSATEESPAHRPRKEPETGGRRTRREMGAHILRPDRGGGNGTRRLCRDPPGNRADRRVPLPQIEWTRRRLKIWSISFVPIVPLSQHLRECVGGSNCHHPFAKQHASNQQEPERNPISYVASLRPQLCRRQDQYRPPLQLQQCSSAISIWADRILSTASHVLLKQVVRRLEFVDHLD